MDIILSIVSLWSYFNIIGYLIMTQFFSVIKIEERYPKLLSGIYLIIKKELLFLYLLIFL